MRVSYNPQDPSQAVLMPGFHADVLWLPGAGLAFVLVGLMFLIVYFSSRYQSSGLSMGVMLFATIFGLAGAAMLAAGGRNLWLAHASLGWPAAAGEVVYSVGESSESVTTDDEGYQTRSKTYSTRVVYSYVAGGAARFGNIRRFGQISGSSAEWAAEIALRYPKGRAVTVAYKPGDEDTSVLEPGISSDAWWIPGIGLACLLFALAAGIFVVPAIGADPEMPPGFSMRDGHGHARWPQA